jgi:UDP-N-acetylglucosamine--N-acetylmuramyl-(pentapeptide) pyrophosphoryl-undecaprenol N-acetylglucosamine transferase
VVDVILTNFEATANYLKAKEKVICVGNPLSEGFSTVDREMAREQIQVPKSCRYVVLSYGGSLGASMINRSALELMRGYSAQHPEVYHMHGCGRIDGDLPKQKFHEFGLEEKSNLMLSEYLYDMPSRMAAADVVICRAGAMTLSELAAIGKAAILIPSPNVTDNHQYKNAKVLADAGAAVLLEEKELVGDRLAREVDALLSDAERRKQMSQRITSFADRETDEKIYRVICKLTEKK